MSRFPLPLAAILLTGIVAAGCGNAEDLYPLKLHEQWTYTVKNSFSTRVQKVAVARQIPVALTTGYELDGPMGISRLAWRDGTLYAEALPNTRIYKPIPLLVAKVGPATLHWSGEVQTLAGNQKAEATMVQVPDSIELGARKLDTVRSNLTVKLPNKTVELDTWYAKGIGPVKQDERTNGNLDVHVELLDGP
ncbi:MAG TPA: hypothetical protein VGL56_10880 [Fimbriimonadaceae bacterium]|jgi:hypothetical protein